MHASPRDAYLETQVNTATPQRLRLMLIDGALRRVKAAIIAFDDGRAEEGKSAVGHGRDFIAELIAGVAPEKSPLAGQILGIYAFLLTTLVESQFTHDTHRLTDVIRVLEEERTTWQAVCQQMPERPVAAPTAAVAEELAPQRVTDTWTTGYAPTPHSRQSFSSELSLEA